MITLEQQKIELGEKKVLDVKQFIVTKIGKEQYGINIQYVNNIVRMQKITRVPKAQYY